MPLTSTTTPEQFATAFATALAGQTPANPPPMALTALLGRHRRTLQQYAAKGYSAEQIAAALKHPDINVTIGAQTVKRILSAGKAKRRREPIHYTARLPDGTIIDGKGVIYDPHAQEGQPQK